MAIEKTIAIPDSILNAENIKYENTNSGLASTEMQSAIDELNTKIDDIEITGGGGGVSLDTVQTMVDETYENAVAYTNSAVSGKADLNHNHDSAYDTKGSADEALASAKEYTNSAVNGKADSNHNHDDKYDALGSANEALNSAKSYTDTKINELPDYVAESKEYTDSVVNGKANLEHGHTIADVEGLQTALDSKSDSTHNHDDKYDSKGSADSALVSAKEYVDTVASGKADSDHNHDDKYDSKGAADTALDSAKEYTDTKTANLASTTVVDNKVSTHNTSTSAHNDIRVLIEELTTRLNTLANSTDEDLDQMAEIVAYIKSNKSLIDSITTSKINVSDIVDNLTTASTSKVLSSNQGVAIKALIDALENELDSHTHAISDVSGLQSALDGKAASSHGTHVSFDSTNKPKMDGTAAFGTSSKVARADHVHPTDTSRASQADLDALEAVVDGKAASSHTHAISDVTNLQTTLDGKVPTTRTVNGKALSSNVTLSASDVGAAASSHTHSSYVNQNAFSNVKVGDTTVAADTTTDTLTLVAGSNVTITPDATNDKITIAATNTTYSAAGSSLGLVKSGGDVTISSGVITVNDDSHNHTIDNVDNLQTTLDTINSELDGSIKGLSVSGKTITYTKNDGTTGTITTQDTNTTYSNMTAATADAAGKAGLVPAPAAGKQSSFLRGDGTWVVPTNTTYSNFVKSGSGAKAGLVPAPSTTAGTTKYLREDGTWATPPDNNTVYTHPTYTARTGVPTANQTPAFGGTFSVSQPTSDATGHVTGMTSRTITIPNATATTSASGLMSSTDKTKLDATNIAYGTCSTDAATAAKVITISGNTNWKLAAGSIISVKFSATNSASNPTFNVNSTGAKSVWYNTALITTSNLGYAGTANRPMNFVYDGTQYVFVGWSYDANSTYSNAGLGQGYGTCSTAAATTAKVVSLSSYSLTTGGIVAVKFTYAVPASATMNINSKGAKSIYHRGAAIKDGIINAGDIATFIYNGSQYHLLGIDQEELITTAEIDAICVL